jgi:teichuronic acid biosynthesis glycosyltransferase TuaH
MSDREVVLALGHHTWADGVRRQRSWSPDRVAGHLVDDPAIAQLLVSDPLRSQLARLRSRAVPVDADFPHGPTRHLVRPRRWRRLDSGSLPGNRLRYRHLDGWLRRRAAARGLSAPVLVTCHPVLAAVADPDAWRDVVYYGWDDWLSYPRLTHARELMAWAYERMAERRVRVIGVTPAIVERIGSPRSTVVPNGILAADHEQVAGLPDWYAALRGPIALYAGSLQERVDVEAVARCAEELPDWDVVLVGPMVDPTGFDALTRLPNVHLRGPEPRGAVLAMMARADVGLVPHRRTAMTEAMSPLKLYEYLASGAPVVATDLSPMRGVSDRVLLAPPGASLAPAVRAAARLPRLTEAELAVVRREHDWSARYRDWRLAALDF